MIAIFVFLKIRTSIDISVMNSVKLLWVNFPVALSICTIQYVEIYFRLFHFHFMFYNNFEFLRRPCSEYIKLRE